MTLTLTFSLDDDLIDDTPMNPDGDSRYADNINALRTVVHHHTQTILNSYDPILSAPEVEYHGVT